MSSQREESWYSSQSSKSSSRHVHSFGEWTVVVEPTCTEMGLEECRCACGETMTNAIQPFGHMINDDEWKVVREPTCEVSGLKTVLCERCYMEVEMEIDPLGHDYVALSKDVDPNFVAPQVGVTGQRTYECQRCHAQTISAVPAKSRSLTFDSAYLSKDEVTNIITIHIKGQIGPYTLEEFEWAFALAEATGTGVGGNTGKFVYGSSSPSEEDFIYTPDTFDEELGEYSISFTFSDLPFISEPDGPYRLYAGPMGSYRYKSINSIDSTNYEDGIYRYYLRNDSAIGSYLSICFDKLPPFAFNDATISFKENNEGNIDTWVKIEGPVHDQTVNPSAFLNQLNSNDVFIQFHDVDSKYYSLDNGSGDIEYNFEVYKENDLIIAAINIKITFMITQMKNTTYNSHLNVLQHKQLNCVMDKDFSHIYDVPRYTKRIEVFSNHAGPATKDNSYGNLGFRVSEQ